MESKWTSEKETVEKLSYKEIGRRYCSLGAGDLCSESPNI